jgi:hypothetical protein
VNQLRGDLLHQLAQTPRIAEVQVQVVDDEQKDAARNVLARPRRRQDDAISRGGRGGGGLDEDTAAMAHRHHDDFLPDPVFQQLEIGTIEIRHEPAGLIPNGHVGGDELDPASDDLAAGYGLRFCSRRFERVDSGGDAKHAHAQQNAKGAGKPLRARIVHSSVFRRDRQADGRTRTSVECRIPANPAVPDALQYGVFPGPSDTRTVAFSFCGPTEISRSAG